MARTGRPRTFTEHDVIGTATDIFWQHGYTGTTMQRLAAGMGLLPGSLHSAFGDKHALFIRALRGYSDAQREFGHALRQPGPVLPRLREMLYGIADAATTTQPRGCLLGNTAAELAGTDPVATAVVHDAFTELETAVAQALARGQHDGEINAAIDATAQARVLVALMQGLHILARVRTDPHQLRAAVDAALAALTPPHPASPGASVKRTA